MRKHIVLFGLWYIFRKLRFLKNVIFPRIYCWQNIQVENQVKEFCINLRASQIKTNERLSNAENVFGNFLNLGSFLFCWIIYKTPFNISKHLPMNESKRLKIHYRHLLYCTWLFYELNQVFIKVWQSLKFPFNS